MKQVFLSFLIAISSFSVFAQADKDTKPDKPIIEVNGRAELEIVPDEIYVLITLRERSKNTDKWKIETQEDNLKNKLKEKGFDLANLSLSDASGDLQYGGFLRKNKVLTEKRLTMKLATAGEVNKLFQVLDELEIEDANITRTWHSKMDELKKQTKIRAMQAAKAKADYLLTAIGEQTGKPLHIRETDYTPVYQQNMLSNVMERATDGAQSGGLGNDISFTKIKVAYEIYAKFEIK